MVEQLLVRLKINNIDRELYLEPRWTLYDALNETLELASVRQSCDGLGECGHCIMLVDGKPIHSCLTLAIECEGRDITTVESLVTSEGKLHPIQEAFLKYDAFQCGHCAPAFVLCTKALLDENPNPTEDEIKEALSGVMCKEGGYYHLIEAVKSLKTV